MAKTAFNGSEVSTVGALPEVGSQAGDFELVGGDLSPVKLADFAGKRLVLNIFPSIDTGICATSVRKFNELAAELDNTAVLCVSNDLPFAQGRFCGAEGIENVTTASAFRSSFGEDYGVKMVDGPLAGLLGRSVIVLDESGKVIYSKLNEEIKTEPNYDEAVSVLGA